MVNMRAGIGLEMRGHPVYRAFKGNPFIGVVVPPPKAELRAGTIAVMHAPQVIESALFQRITLKVEKQEIPLEKWEDIGLS